MSISNLCDSLNNSQEPSLQRDGYAFHRDALSDVARQRLTCDLDALNESEHAPGIRHLMRRLPRLELLLDSPLLRTLISETLSPRTRPVRAISFDKTAARNWGLPWHQDRTIAVKERVEVPGFGPWTCKGGIHHVEPPVEILERMITLRIHLDRADAATGALYVIPGSHCLGRLTQDQIHTISRERTSVLCAADAGDVLVMKPLLIHRSRKAEKPARRRVLHVEFSADPLPAPLAWGDC